MTGLIRWHDYTDQHGRFDEVTAKTEIDPREAASKLANTF